jgi:hypothetical protein
MSNTEIESIDAPEEEVSDDQNFEGDQSEVNRNITEPDRIKEDDPGLAPENDDVLAPFLSKEERRIDPTEEELPPSNPV